MKHHRSSQGRSGHGLGHTGRLGRPMDCGNGGSHHGAEIRLSSFPASLTYKLSRELHSSRVNPDATTIAEPNLHRASCPPLAFVVKIVLLLFNMLQARVTLSPAFPYRSSSEESTRFLLPHPLLPLPAGGLWLCTSAVQRAIIFCFPQLCI